MTKIDPVLIQKLRIRTGLGMLDCKNALEKTEGNIEKAIELLRKKGALIAEKRAGKETAQGMIHSYIHPGSRIGVLVEINCETDFVARTQQVCEFANDLCLQITALKPLFVSEEQVSAEFITHEKNIFREQLKHEGKPEKIINTIIEGKLKKLYAQICLIRQPFVKNDQKTIDQVLKELIAKTGENIKIKRFSRFEIGV